MAVHIEDHLAFLLPGHPLLGQGRVPKHGASGLLAQQLQFLPERAHFGNPIQAQKIPPFPGSHITQLFDGFDSRHRHQRHQQKDTGDAVKTIRQFIRRGIVAQQPGRQQSR